MKYSRNAKNRANTGEWLVRCTLDSSKLIRNTSGRFMIDRSITECLSSPFISISFGNSFGKSYIRFFSSKNLPRIGSFALARNLYRDERNSPLCKFSRDGVLGKEYPFPSLGKKEGESGKLVAKGRRRRRRKRNYRGSEGAVREHVYTLFVHIPLTIYIGVRAVWIDNDRLPGTWPPLRRFFPRFVSRWLCLSAYLRRYM